MQEITIDEIEKNTDDILEKVGKESFVNWATFTESSTEVSRAIDQLNLALNRLRQLQHKTFIPTMKKLKSYDIPDLLQTVKTKKLPKEALKGVLPRFTTKNEKIQLVEEISVLKQHAVTELNQFVNKNKGYIQILSTCTEQIHKKIEESGVEIQRQKIEESFLSKIPLKKVSLNEDLAIKIASQIKIQYIPKTQLITLQTYQQLIERVYELIKLEFQKLTIEARKEQRENINNYKEYQRCMVQYIANSEGLISDGQKLLSEKVGISADQLMNSELALAERGFTNEIILIQAQFRAKIKEAVVSKKEASLDVAKQIIKYQIKIIQQNVSEFNKIFQGLEITPESIQLIPNLLGLILHNLVYEKFGFEEEDYLKCLASQNMMLSNFEFAKIFGEMEIAILKLMPKLEVIPQQLREQMKQQQDLALQSMGMNPAFASLGLNPGQNFMTGPPGLGQSSNPMDMLQMQQMQQMQSMFNQMGLQNPI